MNAHEPIFAPRCTHAFAIASVVARFFQCLVSHLFFIRQLIELSKKCRCNVTVTRLMSTCYNDAVLSNCAKQRTVLTHNGGLSLTRIVSLFSQNNTTGYSRMFLSSSRHFDRCLVVWPFCHCAIFLVSPTVLWKKSTLCWSTCILCLLKVFGCHKRKGVTSGLLQFWWLCRVYCKTV